LEGRTLIQYVGQGQNPHAYSGLDVRWSDPDFAVNLWLDLDIFPAILHGGFTEACQQLTQVNMTINGVPVIFLAQGEFFILTTFAMYHVSAPLGRVSAGPGTLSTPVPTPVLSPTPDAKTQLLEEIIRSFHVLKYQLVPCQRPLLDRATPNLSCMLLP
jgi:hypothetical protein